jgi:hypothetical protein
MLVVGLLLLSREMMTLAVAAIFWFICHANLRGWGYIFIADQDNQHMPRC